MTALRIGTRASALALWQAKHVEALIRAQPGAPAVELVPIRTEGDVRTDVPLWAIRGRAFFTKEIDRALLDGQVDIAVHSLKDLATELESGIDLAAALEREDPRDALISRDGRPLAELPAGARIGTSSLRRRAFLARLRPDARLLELRGNVPTRVARLTAGDYDAIVLAAAGLKRLGLDQHVTELLSPRNFPPAVSQGAIGVCIRAGDGNVLRWVEKLDHLPTRLATTAERALLRQLEAGCQVPMGALGELTGADDDSRLEMRAAVCALDGSTMLAVNGAAPANALSARDLGRALADELVAQGAGKLIATERDARRSGEISS